VFCLFWLFLVFEFGLGYLLCFVLVDFSFFVGCLLDCLDWFSSLFCFGCFVFVFVVVLFGLVFFFVLF
jgi:hypothetical protein